MINKIQKHLSLCTILFLVLGLYFFLQPSSTSAYQCEQPPPLAEEIKQSSAIFVGKVTDIYFLHEAGTFVNFEVKRTHKGNVGKTTNLKVDTIGGSGYGFCGVHLKIDETYLIYASGDPLSTNICTRGIGSCNRTKILKDASEDLAILEVETTPSAPAETEKTVGSQPLEETGSPERKISLLSTEILIIGFIMLIVGIFIGGTLFARKGNSKFLS